MGALIAIKERRFTIPNDIGIIWFDDSDWALISEPSITVIRQLVHQLGSTAAEILIKKIEDEEKKLDHKPTVVTLSTELIIRNSTKRQILVN
jgi:LacI family transcriptional regulator